ncbi:PTS mannose/fructose/sorbose/N-acetylgalactosamine transporter subunit IIC [Lacticaseibacillus absianus]|uniref:PTS mannose/fructose/sorbose/N-acetylgalactosamine transporter subunit IIC n=1 Tax=Lacticaseibacillus absianus TaxID=2729623 RepID=UPI0015C88AC3|nr:PTS mannose/fructose/sorbose/N-acetylgalactosamine transporter subunit IIC [Lacticaseibacillus absianus]
MQITIIQALLIGLWTAFCYTGMLWGIYTNRALVLSFGVGVILHDIPTALAVGAVSELAFMGFGVGAGGTVPPNPIGPGIIGTLMAITMHGVTPQSALALSIPFAIAIQFLQTFVYTLGAGLPEAANNALKAQKFGKFRFFSNATVYLFATVGFLLGFLGAFSMTTLKSLVGMIPDWLLTGLSVAGGMLPAIGFAMIMSVMLKKEFIPFALLGYALAAFLQLPVIGIAIIGLVFALKHYFDVDGKEEAAPATAATASTKDEEGSRDDWI